jgi:prepilin-type N-terminal cleavage/methylation domain-containing protein
VRVLGKNRSPAPGFTLAEILIAVAVLTVLVLLLTSLASGVNKAWVIGEQRVQSFQDGRAILDLMSRELSQAVISPSLQLVTNPSLSGTAGNANELQYSDSIFWQAPGQSTTSGNISEIGYYLTSSFRMQRFYVPPTDSSNYKIFAAAPSDTTALWATDYVGNSALNSPLSDGVLGFWVRCLDSNGESIPWVPSGAPIHFNSAARFQPAVPSQSGSFKYTSTSTVQAHLLPTSVELTIITLDSKTLQRVRSTIPPMRQATAPDQITTTVQLYNQDLANAHITSARTFSTIVRLKSSTF